jgi:hypothetical protein
MAASCRHSPKATRIIHSAVRPGHWCASATRHESFSSPAPCRAAFRDASTCPKQAGLKQGLKREKTAGTAWLYCRRCFNHFNPSTFFKTSGYTNTSAYYRPLWALRRRGSQPAKRLKVEVMTFQLAITQTAPTAYVRFNPCFNLWGLKRCRLPSGGQRSPTGVRLFRQPQHGCFWPGVADHRAGSRKVPTGVRHGRHVHCQAPTGCPCSRLVGGVI